MNGKTNYFRPSSQVLGVKTRGARGELASNRYLGDTSLPDNSGHDVLPYENVNLWIVNIPKEIDHHEFLGCIRNTGKVRSLVLHPPVGKHTNKAAALSFIRRDSAVKFLADCRSGKINMRGMKLYATWNRNRVREPADDTVSRVLMIEGDAKLVNQKHLNEFFAEKVAYDIDEIIEHGRKEGSDAARCTIEYRFASWRGQAQLALMALRTERQSLTVEYGKDPCE
ncbi:hypothetical protein GGR53DRAFT_468566 [Hypoxylon sp. FL1150]|nr:hypothetical protein GGR53DRAFT_468566 [Hypoxylon sp. FL1150]